MDVPRKAMLIYSLPEDEPPKPSEPLIDVDITSNKQFVMLL